MKKKSSGKKRIIIVLFCLVVGIFFWYENHHLVVSRYQYQSPKVMDDLNGYCIVQISDLHNTLFGKQNKHLLEQIKNLSPDIIVVTGDVIDSNHTKIEVAVDFVKEAIGIAPVYYVTGNHEYWLEESQRQELLQGIEKCGGVIVSDEKLEVSESMSLIGLEDVNLLGNTLHTVMNTVKQDELTILLAHEPQYFSSYASEGVDLVLSGHAHGGQFRLPLLGGVVAPDQGFFPKLTEGMHHNGNTTMIISRGLGNSVIPIRIFNDPEIVCVEFKKMNEMEK